MGSARDVMLQLFQVAGAGDADGLMALVSDDIVIHQAGKSLLAGEYKGKDGFVEYRRKVAELTAGTLSPELHELLGEGEHAVVLFQFSAERNGRSATWNEAGIYHIRDGKLAEVWIVPEDLYKFDEFWS